MQEITKERLEKGNYLLFIYSPFCGTCHVARSMLEKIESVHQTELFDEMNASLYADFMQDKQIESVPCLLIMQNNVIKEKVYAFRSIPNIYNYLMVYRPELFAKS